MHLDILDNEELLRLAIAAMGDGRDAEALAMLKLLLDRQPGDATATYLLGAQYAQLGMMDRAEDAFRAAVARAPELRIARFQLGQLLAVQGDVDGAEQAFAPLDDANDALAAYGRALVLLAREEVDAGIRALDEGLAFEQPVAALASDMQRLRDTLVQNAGFMRQDVLHAPAPAYLAGYGYGTVGAHE